MLDTCEHILDACALLVDVLLPASPGLHILATSRRPLDVVGEEVFAIPPLAVPDPDDLEKDDLRYDSVVLFADRAGEVDSSFALTSRNQTEVARLCQRLDGIPLAIELAAVWLPVLSVEQIVERLDHRFKLLSDGHDELARHETLRAAIGWSHELCTPLERLLWARLSVFVGAFDVAVAVSVCTDEHVTAETVPGLLAGLADRSILFREGHGDDVRFRLLDTLREYGAQWLDALDERRTSQRRHRDYYLAMAKRCEAEFCGPDQVDWCDRMWRELANLRAALEFSLSDPVEQSIGLEMAGSLYFFWVPGGLIREGRYYLDWALDLDLPPSPALTKALWICGRIANAQGDMAAAESLVERCRPHIEQDDVVAAGNVAYILGTASMLRGDWQRATSLLDEAVELLQRDKVVSVWLLFTLSVRGTAHALSGDVNRAVELMEECRGLCERYGERWVRSYADILRSLVELDRGNVAAAVRYGRDSLRFKLLLPDPLGTAMALDALASAAAAGAKGGRAATLLGFADHVWHTFGLPQFGSPELIARRRQCEQQARTALGEVAYLRAFQQGRELDLVTGIGYALGTDLLNDRSTSPTPLSADWNSHRHFRRPLSE